MHFFLNHTAWTPLWLVQAAMTIWMLVDANRRGVESYWFWIIFIFQPLGPWAYFFVYKIKDFTGVSHPYEEPLHPEVVIETDREKVEESVSRILRYLESKGWI